MDLILACHVKNNNWYKLINHNLSKIIDYCSSIYVVYSISDNVDSIFFEENIINKNVNFIKVKNEGYDFKKYKVGLSFLNATFNPDWNVYINRYPDLQAVFGDNTIEAEKHWNYYGKNEGRICNLDTNKSVILMNDSFIFSRNIHDIMNNIKEKINNKFMFVGLSRCDVHKQHYQSYFWVLNYNLIPILYDILTEDRLDSSMGSENIIMKCEVDISNLFINRYKSDFIYHTNSDNLILKPLVRLLNNGYPIIKFQCLKRTKYNFNSIVHLPKKVWIKKRKKEIKDFNPKIYKELHNELKHMSDKELTYHFFLIGIDEGRKYKYNQPSFIPQDIKILLNKTGLQYQDFI